MGGCLRQSRWASGSPDSCGQHFPPMHLRSRSVFQSATHTGTYKRQSLNGSGPRGLETPGSFKNLDDALGENPHYSVTLPYIIFQDVFSWSLFILSFSCFTNVSFFFLNGNENIDYRLQKLFSAYDIIFDFLPLYISPFFF